MSSGAEMDLTNAIGAIGGFLYHSNEDIWSIYGVSLPSFILPSGIDVTPAYLEKRSKSVAVSKTEAGGGASDNSMNWNEAAVQ